MNKVKDIAPPIPDIPFAEPTKNMPNINLASQKIQGLADQVRSKGSELKEAASELKKSQAKLKSGLSDALDMY